MKVKQAMCDFIMDKMPSYQNPMGVQLYLNPDSSFIICCDYPDFVQPADIRLELLEEIRSLTMLVALLQLSTQERLLMLSPEQLLLLYGHGRMHIVCTLETEMDQALYFLNFKGEIWARNSEDVIHKVMEDLTTPEDFIDYTIRYYQMNSN